MEILWWHWVSFGLVLIGAELFIPSFTIIWFGIGGCGTGLYLYVFPNASFSAQLLVWSVLSVLMTILWFSILRPKMVDKSKAGMSQEAIVGETGMVIRGNASVMERGRVRFAVPLLGAEEWDFICETPCAPGDRVRVLGIEGHVLQAERIAEKEKERRS